ncbi:MAG: HEPN domain-containing protein [Chloroflexota bacterium]
MPRNESTYPADWLRIAEKDYARVERLLGNRDPEMAGFCLQQALEKFFKAFLLSKGWQLRRIHNLDTLLDDAVNYEPALEKFRAACQKITAFYFVERYPLMTDIGLTEKDVRESWAQVRDLVEKIRTALAKVNKETE